MRRLIPSYCVIGLIALGSCAAKCDSKAVQIDGARGYKCVNRKSVTQPTHTESTQTSSLPFKTKSTKVSCKSDKLLNLLNTPNRLKPDSIKRAYNIRDLHLDYGWGIVIAENESELELRKRRKGYRYSAKRIKGSDLCRKWLNCPIPEGDRERKLSVAYGVAKRCKDQVCQKYIEESYEDDYGLYNDDKPPGVFEFCGHMSKSRR